MLQRKKLALLALALSIALATAVAAQTVLTWELEFEASEPEVETEIEIGEPIVVGVETYVLVCMNTEDGIGELFGHLTVELYFFHEGEHEWVLLETLEDEAEVVLGPEPQCFDYPFTPEEAGSYKVVVAFEVG